MWLQLASDSAAAPCSARHVTHQRSAEARASLAEAALTIDDGDGALALLPHAAAAPGRMTPSFTCFI